ncbi:UNVERIFIED_CONTAM: hypothetical protein Slati_0866800 [Sesamum latifolium]|uniref:Uncharacterized protein n=1 Tax=Sesamum latifolium TaxID=2727402 RepID=A0AAW2XSK5_9LAMI
MVCQVWRCAVVDVGIASRLLTGPYPFSAATMRPARRISSMPMTEQMDSLLPTSSESPPMISCPLAPALSQAPTPLSSIKVSKPAMPTRVSPNPTLNYMDVGNFDPLSMLQDFLIGSSDMEKRR